MTLPDAATLSPPVEARRVSVALVLASLVTLSAAVPLGVLAWQASDDTASVDGIVVTVGGEEQPLSGLELERGEGVLVAIELPDVVAVSWAIHHADDAAGDNSVELEAVGQGQLARPPQADAASRMELAEPSALIEVLDRGRYDLLITATTATGSTTQRAARFEIGDAQ